MKINIKDREFITGILFLAVAAVYGSQIPGIKLTKISVVNSAMFPKFYTVALVILAVCQLYQAWQHTKSAPAAGTDQAKEEKKTDFACVTITLGLSLVYVILLEPLGFLISSILYLEAQMITLCPKEKSRPLLFLAVSVIAAFATYYIFRNGLHLMLPAGILTGIL